MSLYDLVVPLGIITYALALVTAALGLFKKILPPKIRLKAHKLSAFALVGVATVHGVIVLYYHFFAN